MNATPVSDKTIGLEGSGASLPNPIEIKKVVQRWTGHDGRVGFVNLEVVAPLHPFSIYRKDVLYTKGPWRYALFALRNIPLRGEKFDWERWCGCDETVAFWKKLNLLPENLS